jgi:putative ABC transport system ATP-binding protein
MSQQDLSYHAAEVHLGHAPARPIRRLLAVLAPETQDIFFVVLFSLGIGLLSLATPIAVQALVDNIQFGVMLQPLFFLVLALLACLSLAAMLTGLESYLVEFITQRMFVRTVGSFAERIPRVRAESFDRTYAPELINRFFDVMKVQKGVSVLLVDGVNSAVALLVGLIVLAVYHQYLLAFALILVFLLVILFFVVGWGGVRTGLAESHAKYEVVSWLEELGRFPLAFKFGGGRFALDRADDLTAHWVRARRDHFRVWFRQFSFSLLIYVAASTALLGLGGWLVIERQLTFGQLVAAELIVGIVAASFLKIGKYLDAWYDVLVGVEKLGLVTDLPVERQTGSVSPQGNRPVRVTLRDASAPFGSGRLSLDVAPGERVAMAGASGVGKSVALDIIAGLREPASGAVLHDGLDLRDLRLDDARSRVALVRGPEIFAGSVTENLRLTQPDATPDEMTDVLDAVGLLGVLRTRLNGLETDLTTGGPPLTECQSLRLTLARALLCRPDLLLIDEALDRVDLTGTPRLLDAVFRPDQPWTLILVSSRPEVLARCGRTVTLTPAPGGER